MPRLEPVEELFKRRHFDQEIIVLCVRWYLSYKLSYRDLTNMLSERGISLGTHDHSAVGIALHPGIRKAMGPICATGRRFMAV